MRAAVRCCTDCTTTPPHNEQGLLLGAWEKRLGGHGGCGKPLLLAPAVVDLTALAA